MATLHDRLADAQRFLDGIRQKRAQLAAAEQQVLGRIQTYQELIAETDLDSEPMPEKD